MLVYITNMRVRYATRLMSAIAYRHPLKSGKDL